MKATVFILGALAVPTALGAAPPAPVAPHYYLPPGVTNRLPMTLFSKTNLLRLYSLTNGVRVYTNVLPALAARRGAPATLAPGVYETAPFSCIVVAPGPHPDDKMAKRAAPMEMPAAKPDLRFIPRKNKGK